MAKLEFFAGIEDLPKKIRNKLSEQAQWVFLNTYNEYLHYYVGEVAWKLAWDDVMNADLLEIAKEDEIQITKSDDDEQLVFGWANVSINSDGTLPVDYQDDITLPETLEKAAYQFVLKYRASGEQHQGDVQGHLVESIMFTKDKMEALGIPEGTVSEGWWVGFHIPNQEVFEKVKKGHYKMFSIEGTAKRLKVGGD